MSRNQQRYKKYFKPKKPVKQYICYGYIVDIYNHTNRDRPGGHLFKTYYGHLDSNYNAGAERKRINRRLKRRTNKLQINEGLKDHVEAEFDAWMDLWDSWNDWYDWEPEDDWSEYANTEISLTEYDDFYYDDEIFGFDYDIYAY